MINQISVGDYFEEDLIFDYDKMIAFLDIVKDINPIHRLNNDELNDQSKLDTLTVQGMYGVCMFSGLLSSNFPDSINVSRHAIFVRPMYLSDHFKITLKVKEIKTEDSIAVLKGYIRNSRGKTCVDCTTEIRNEKLFDRININE